MENLSRAVIQAVSSSPIAFHGNGAFCPSTRGSSAAVHGTNVERDRGGEACNLGIEQSRATAARALDGAGTAVVVDPQHPSRQSGGCHKNAQLMDVVASSRPKLPGQTHCDWGALTTVPASNPSILTRRDP
jgi:hypothetical protein